MKIDITKIEGYREDMTADEKLELLLNYEVPAPDYSGYVKKSVFDKTASELADAKKKLKEKMTEEEVKEAEMLAEQQALKEELENLRRDKALSEHMAKLLELGYAADLAADTARALVEGDMSKVFENQQKHIENVKKAERAAALGGTPAPPAGSGIHTTITKEQFDVMGYSERLKLFNEQPETYKKFTEG